MVHSSALAPGIALVIPTLNAGEKWRDCLKAIESQSLRPSRKLVIDSTSTDKTVELARAAGFEVVSIPASQFNHGGTRQWAIDYLVDSTVIVFLTQDAILASPEALAQIVASLEHPRSAVAYGRQLPHKNATPIEAHARIFNYGPHTVVKNAASAGILHTKTFFCSNSFAAYRRTVLVELGGFRRDLILGEDMEFAARAIDAGYANVYCATAPVYHSHDYTFVQILERYFDIGVFDERNPWMQRRFGSHRGEGMRFVKSELQYLLTRAPLQIPRALVQTATKAIGYRLGRMERLLPTALKRKLSMFPRFWNTSKES
jgi:rhamnosyltransferase